MSEFAQLLEDYAAIRTFIEDEEAKIKPLKDVRDKIQAALQAQMNTMGVTNAKSVDGHAVVLATTNSAKVADADAFFNWVFEQGDDSFLQKRVAADRVKQYVDETNELPPGVTMDSVITLRFTRSKTK